MPLSFRIVLTITLIAWVGGCAKWNPAVAPAGSAIIREHTMGKVVFENSLPVSSTLDFTLVAIDGMPVTRETIPPLVDMQAGALVPAGSHEFKLLASPHARPPNHRPVEMRFTASVQSGKVYNLVDKDGAPALVEVQAQPR